MKIGDYVLYRHMNSFNAKQCYCVGRVIESKTSSSEFYVQKPSDGTYWTSCKLHENGTYVSLMGYQMIPATEEMVAEALLLALSGEEISIPLEVGDKLVKEYNDQNWRLCLAKLAPEATRSVLLGEA